MRAILISLAAATTMLAGGGEARAQEAASYSQDHLALAREVAAAAGGEELLDDMMRQMAPMMAEQIVSRGASREFANRFVEIFIEEFTASTPEINELTAIAYAGAFTEAQLGDLLTFYRSPTGQVLVSRMTEMTAAMMQAGTILGEEAAQRSLQRLMAEQGNTPPQNP